MSKFILEIQDVSKYKFSEYLLTDLIRKSLSELEDYLDEEIFKDLKVTKLND